MELFIYFKMFYDCTLLHTVCGYTYNRAVVNVFCILLIALPHPHICPQHFSKQTCAHVIYRFVLKEKQRWVKSFHVESDQELLVCKMKSKVGNSEVPSVSIRCFS